MSDSPEVTFSVIIPNFNGRNHLEVCLSSLRRQSISTFEVILVDNASVDGSVDYVNQNFPEVCVVQLSRNEGFTGACNAGAEVAKGRYITLLNNDTEVDPGWLAALAEAFNRHAQVGIVASKIMLFDERQRFHAAGDFYRVDGVPGNRGVWETDIGQYDEEEFVFSACGAAAAYRRRLIEEIGFLDDRFFFSCEDVDMGWRAHLAGWSVLYTPKAIVYHKLKATGGSVTGSYYDGRNFLYLIWKDYPASLLKRYWRKIVGAQLKIAWQALRSWRGAAARARLRGMMAGLLGLPRMLPQRRKIQRTRRLPDEKLLARLTPVDASDGAS